MPQTSLKHFLNAGIVFLLGAVAASAQPLRSLGIEVRGTSRPFVYTNKESAFYYGETGGPNTTSWQGFNVRGREFLDDYLLLVNGKPFPRTAASTTIVYPDHLERHYPGGILEEVWPADSLPLVGITLTFPAPADAGVLPLLSDGTSKDDFVVRLREGMALIARRREVTDLRHVGGPVWFGLAGAHALPESVQVRMGRQFAPARVYEGASRRHTFVFGVGSSEEGLETMLRAYPHQAARYQAERQRRMENVLAGSFVQTADPRLTRALAWAKLSLDALLMNQTGKGIFAGLPWFNNYWGRDTFIALPGAALVTARYADARAILRSFAEFQQRDSSRTDYGRIPNIVTTTDTAYNTADGTPRFVMMTREYVERSGDDSLLLELYPVIIRSIEGTLRYHADSLGFLTHGDAETWMDAVGPDGPWSPRGNRANDVQALWARQLECGIWCATRLGDVPSARRWDDVLQKLRTSFRRLFIRAGSVADHVTAAGEPDMRVRPNQVFVSPLVDISLRASVLQTVLSRLTYPYGVASLAQTDEQFHPYHSYPPFYPKDAAYHNGTIWTWLQGPVISALCAFGAEDTAYILTTNAVHQILDRGAVGTQSELLDGLPRPGETEPRLSGTVSQAWNLAEFVRNFYDDYLGVRVAELTHRIDIEPHVPAGMDSIVAELPLGGRTLTVTAAAAHDRYRLSLSSPPLPQPYTVAIVLPDGHARGTRTTFAYQGGMAVSVNTTDTVVHVHAAGATMTPATTRIDLPRLTAAATGLHFAVPSLRPDLPALQGPPYLLLNHAEVTAVATAPTPLVQATDPIGDDIGVGPVLARGGRYTYPANANFRPGSFDITAFTVVTDSARVFFTLSFRTLSDPGWHPEYGFQLTFVAIAIDTDNRPGSGGLEIPAGSHYRLPPDRGFERLILVGGGVQVEDADGRILAAYAPTEQDAVRPIGDADRGTIRFAVPRAVIGTPAPGWRFTVVAGAQDDHGGAGIGEFRRVQGSQGEWHGGGRESPEEPNIYDELLVR